MPTGAPEHARVTFPADPAFARLGTVTASGIAIRLGFDIGRVEQLRTAVTTAVLALVGSGAIDLHAEWDDESFELEISNAEATIDTPAQVAGSIEALVTDVDVSADAIHLTLRR